MQLSVEIMGQSRLSYLPALHKRLRKGLRRVRERIKSLM